MHREAQRLGFELDIGPKVQISAQSLSHGAHFEIGDYRLGVERGERQQVQHDLMDGDSQLLRHVFRIRHYDGAAETDRPAQAAECFLESGGLSREEFRHSRRSWAHLWRLP